MLLPNQLLNEFREFLKLEHPEHSKRLELQLEDFFTMVEEQGGGEMTFNFADEIVSEFYAYADILIGRIEYLN